MAKIIFAISLLGIFINNVKSQYTIASTIKLPTQQITNAVPQASKQQLLNCFLSPSNQAPLGERIELLATTVRQMPVKGNRRVYLADVLKETAFQSLLAAASVCGGGNAMNSLVQTPEAPLQSYATPLPSYVTLPRNVVANVATAPNESPVVASRELLSTLIPREMISLPSYATLPRRSALVAAVPNESPVVANWDLLSTLLPRELLSSLARDYIPNRAARLQYL